MRKDNPIKTSCAAKAAAEQKRIADNLRRVKNAEAVARAISKHRV